MSLETTGADVHDDCAVDFSVKPILYYYDIGIITIRFVLFGPSYPTLQKRHHGYGSIIRLACHNLSRVTCVDLQQSNETRLVGTRLSDTN